MHVGYSDAYLPPAGEEYYLTRDLADAEKAFADAVDNVREWVRNYDETR